VNIEAGTALRRTRVLEKTVAVEAPVRLILGSTIAAAQKDHIVEPDIPVFQVTIACAVIGGGRRGRESGRGSCGF
jgi:hypothetical protein